MCGGRFGAVNSKEIMMLKKIIPILLAVYIFPFNSIYAGCGSCGVSKTKVAVAPANPELIGELSADGVVSGFVLASCGMCNFGMDSKAGCSLAIKIGETTYPVKGTSIADHGDSHAKDGFCNAVSVVSVVGNVKDNIFLAESFEVQKK
ncbi:MAG TPA: hypothetical protein EYO45_06260 [Candidatus Marinimicrobia bacterium]|nr:hypothetical protein [Candidatus Neomarinimicrobiota bacterium]